MVAAPDFDAHYATPQILNRPFLPRFPPLKRDENRMNHRALASCLGTIFSENRFTLFRIMP
jgi:hypothetical protein